MGATIESARAAGRRRIRLGDDETGAEPCPICSHRHRDEIRGSIRPPEILVAEDESSVARLIAYHLEADGCRVSVAEDGLAALDALRRTPPDLLILDLLLPLQSGWQVLRTLRSHPQPELSGLPVLVVSALACERLEKQLSSIGPLRVLGKPFALEDLRESVRSLLAARPSS